MDREVLFFKRFKNKMFKLAALAAVLISASAPISYLTFSILEQRREAVEHSSEIAGKLSEAVKQDQGSWQNNIQEVIQGVPGYRLQAEKKPQVSSIRVFSDGQHLLYEQMQTRSFPFDMKGEAPIIYDNRTFGRVEVRERTLPGILTFVALFLLFGLLGFVFGGSLYRFPSRIVARAEVQTQDTLQKLHLLSYYDTLTKLPNRRHFSMYLMESLEEAGQDGTKMAVIFIDIDRFKSVNDTLGHVYGDLLLQIMAKRLNNCIRDRDLIARLGGDEFAVVLPDLHQEQEAAVIAERIIKSVQKPVTIEGYEFSLSVSLGISIYPFDGTDVETLTTYADVAMYRAKEQGKNKYLFYMPVLNETTKERIKMESRLRQALKDKTGLTLYYQPVVNLTTGKITGAEALLRLKDPELGCISPSQFIPVAEETGLIIPFGEWVLQTALSQCQEWHQKGFEDLFVSINLSPREFQKPNMIESINSILRQTGLDPRWLQVEITENIAMPNQDSIIARINALRKHGIRIAVDDFGMGYSSLSRIKEFPVDTLKIDKSFVSNLPKDFYSIVIVDFVLAMAKSLGLNVVAEGVETDEQLIFLRDRKCDEMQGYLFSAPITKEEFNALLVRRKQSKNIYLVSNART